MINTTGRWFAGALTLLLATSGQAVSFNRIVSLGDSLFDDPEGIRSPLASEQLADRIGAPLTQLAVGGATSTSLIAEGQHTEAAATFGAGDLALLWIGGNDFLDAAPGILLGNLDFLDTLETNVDEILTTLTDAGMTVVVFNLPDISQVPAVVSQLGDVPAIRDASLDWRNRLNALAAAKGVTVVDVFSVFDLLINQPENFTVDGEAQVPSPTFGDVVTCPTCTWADPIHPSSLGQGVISNAAITAVNGAFDPAGISPLSTLSKTEIASLASVNSFVTLAGLWFDPTFDGEGYDVVQTAGGITIFFYGYDNSGNRLWLISELLTERPALNIPVTLTMSVGDGGTFELPIPGAELDEWGTLVMTVTECGAGQFVLDGRDGVKNHSVIKLADVVGTSCFAP
ncbi:MAG: GDSL-type esterase/lipase family protein [Pseudomonadota bacterium]